MSEFDVIECGFNTADETINFGSRMLADGDHLYEACTLATLKQADVTQNTANINLISNSNNGQIYYAINKTIGIFSNLSCTELCFTSVFDSYIDEFCVTPDSKYLFICLRNGSALCINVAEQEIIFNDSINCNNWLEENFFINCFIQSYIDSKIVIVAITKIGQIYRITLDVIDGGNCKYSQDLIVDVDFKITTCAMIYPYLFVDGTNVAIYNLENEDYIKDDGLNLVKVFPYNRDLFIGLSSDGTLLRICARTLLTFNIKNSNKFKDFLYTFYPINESTTKPWLLCVTLENDLELYDSYSILENMKFSLKVSDYIHLIQFASVHDEVMYISIIEKQDVIEELRFQLITETVPELRLKRLLRRRKFDEAEKFAKEYNLSQTEVLKARSQVIVDKTSCNEEDVNNLLEILEKIDDNLFKLQSCIDVYQCCENLKDVQRILSYGCNCVIKSNVSAEVTEIRGMLLDMMFRFDTFALISKLQDCYLDWLDFTQCDLIELLCEYLKKYDIDTAIILYNRLDKHSILKLSEDDVETILNLINSRPLEVFKPFLYSFIPLSLSYLPTTVPLFVEWLKRKVYHIEQNDGVGFPQNAIEFTNSTLRMMKVDGDNINFRQQHIVNKDAIEDLAELVKALKTVQLLKDAYKIIMPLKEYLKGPRPLIHTLLTLDLEDDVFENLLQNFLCKFMLENHLESDNIFLEVIDNMIQYEESCWIKVIPIILQNISSIEIKLTAIQNILNIANIPWNQTLRNIARSSLEYQHPLVQDLKKEIENEPLYRVITKQPYNIQDCKIDDTLDIDYIIGRIIYCNTETMVEDIFQICTTEYRRHFANTSLMDHYIQTRDFKKALEILDNNTADEIIACCEYIVTVVKSYERLRWHDCNEPYLEILKCLLNRWQHNKKLAKKKGDVKFDVFVQNALACSQIRSKLYENITIDNLESPKDRQHLLDTILSNINQALCDNTINTFEAISSCQKIAYYLSESKEWVMIKFCKILTNLEIIEKCANFILENEKSAKNLCLTATLILKHICPSPEISDDLLFNSTITLNETIQEPINDIKRPIICLRLAKNLATKAILFAQPDEIIACIQVFNWTMSTIYMIDESSIIQRNIFPNTYSSEISSPNLRSFYGIQSILNFYISLVITNIDRDLRYLTYFDVPNASLADYSHKILQLPTMVHSFCLEGQTLTAFKLITTFKCSMLYVKSPNAALVETLNKIIRQCGMQLLKKVFASKNIDHELAYGLLISRKPKESLEFINAQISIYKKDINKLKQLGVLALRFVNFHEMHRNKSIYEDLILLANWWIRIKDCEVLQKMFFTLPKDELLKNLIQRQHMDLGMIKEFCEDFHLDIQQYYQIYLKKILLKWKPEYDKVEDVYGKTRINIKSSEGELLEKCRTIVNLIEEKEHLFNFINFFRNEVNYYHYEVFFTIFTILGDLNKNTNYRRKLLLLNFLKTYRRVNKPSDSEAEEWYSLYPDSQAIDPLSQWRLPFTRSLFSTDIWKIIRPELNLRTYNAWFEAIAILDKVLNKNDICSYVIKDIVSSGILQKNVGNSWRLHPIHNNLFEQIDICAQNMTNLEMATSAVYQLVMHTPKGADQVNAAKLCLKYAVQYKDASAALDPAVQKAFIKVQKKYQSFAANHILQFCQIDSDKYMHILLEPHELIEALYMDESILERADSVMLNSPDINMAVDDLGILFDLDIHNIRLKLLETLLLEKSLPNFNVSSVLDNVGTDVDSGDTNSINLKKAAYICQSEDKSKWQEYLVKIGLESSKNLYAKANALSCFVIISDAGTIEKLTELSFNEFRYFIDKLYLLSDLEYLGLSMDIETLDNYKKPSLLRTLANDIYNPIAVKTMANLCMTYAEFDLKIWQIIITTSIKLSLFHHLKKYVNFLKNEPSFKYKKFYIDAWQNVINEAFRTGHISDERLYNLYLENLLLIQSCPVLPSLNFTNVFNKCCNLKMYEFAAVITQYFPPEEQKKSIEKLATHKTDLSLAVEKLSKFGIWGTESVRRLIKHR